MRVLCLVDGSEIQWDTFIRPKRLIQMQEELPTCGTSLNRGGTFNSFSCFGIKFVLFDSFRDAKGDVLEGLCTCIENMTLKV